MTLTVAVDGARAGPVEESLVLERLWMTNFRLFAEATVEPAADGTTVLTGPNGCGKTTVLEAVAFLGSQRSFRGAPRDAMIRSGSDRGYVRGELRDAGRRVTVETELARTGESRAQVNRQRARRANLAAAVPATVFSPDDLAVVQGGPAGRRALLDGALASLDPAAARAVEETERALRQRGALLRQAGGKSSTEIEASLDVWDARLAEHGTVLVAARRALLEDLAPLTEEAYRSLAGGSSATRVGLRYEGSWEGPYGPALARQRRDDLRRAATTVGPHRDDMAIALAGRDSRIQASQGEQRCLALGLRLGLHRLLTARLGRAPLLLLDDVFSELDPHRSAALIDQLPSGQSLLTTAVPIPDTMRVAMVLEVSGLSA